MGNIHRFINGFKLFQQQLYGDNELLAAQLAKGQSPKTLVISCSDSRVDPALLMGCSPGDIFTVRNIANLVPPYELDNAYHGVSAALEYAVCFLKVEDIIVLGHSGCGGIEGLLLGADGNMVGEFVGRWVDIASDARDRAMARVAAGESNDLSCVCEQEAILTSLTNLQTFPWLKKRLLAGELDLHGWYFVIERGELSVYRPEAGRFEVLVEKHNF
ncbi:carbonic anhydrase [Geopsychrobacter electrodiphilus]|uniref:carbonic anhydrase n=1 Tax=Geopsychrobacter electrodiphilus TaxID=225196 RepID=UPI0003609714|nr:carbonic anhydrase [Geopsychrobacter electrodiphilus]